MKNKIILAAIAAPLFFGGMQTSALAACSVTGAAQVQCDSFTLDTIGELTDAVSADRPSLFSTIFNENISGWASLIENAAASGQTTTSLATSAGRNYTVNVQSPIVTGAVAYSYAYYIYANISDGLAEIYTSYWQVQGHISYKASNGKSYQIPGYDGGNNTLLGTYSIQAVPGPEAGAGIGALAMLGVAYWAKRRREEKALAA